MPEPVGVIAGLLEELTKLPGVGPKSAERIAHFLLAGDRRHAVELADALRAVADRVRPCKECFNLTDGELCPICSDPKRDGGLLCVVETPRDVNSFERAGNFRGLYHVLGGRLAPLDGMGPDRLTFTALVERVRRGGVREVILATSPTLEGDGTALLASTVLAQTGVQVTRLARGLPSGSSLELANAQMLAEALDGRRNF
ncbi:Recombination protein RecR [Gemmata obscuriglobus]|uniref:Recombination protein RecR n=1 Tax=Gemmata algarum TaxID=2975278 RepID=A0ABU5F7J6_9BACT|nr:MULTISPECIES: recombination mediator RecR [Gemmata]MDY3554317.1 recombination mediator RecR [Gemmata algarum]MDY3562712.1 recombination mediator RecR [Gemmata algarum]QEG28679.1 Recombination protein RecR [Gemmata obscuriglobus]VTS06922.1 recombination protein : Recombination protein RecR OS=Planctomyces maris DSM 8797 GN=recR PE=3 SV=1: HHH: RecR: Toprim_4 [Gemmata obscuriglobus UQM 2246]